MRREAVQESRKNRDSTASLYMVLVASEDTAIRNDCAQVSAVTGLKKFYPVNSFEKNNCVVLQPKTILYCCIAKNELLLLYVYLIKVYLPDAGY